MGNSNATRGYFGGKSHNHQRLVKQRQLKTESGNCFCIHFLYKKCNKEVSRYSGAKQRQRNVQKRCASRAKLLFLLIRPIVVFLPFSLPSPLSITRFYILFEQTINIIESFAFSHG